MRDRRRMLQTIVVVTAWALAALGGFVLLGWGVGSERLTRIVAGFAAMVPSTAVCFLLAALVVALMRRPRRGEDRARRIIERAVAVILLVIASLDLAVIAFTAHAGIDDIVFGAMSDADGPVSMSPATAIGFLLVGACVFLQSLPAPMWRRARRAFHVVATVLLALSLVALTAYLFDASSLYSVSLLTAMALHTAFGFTLTAIGLLAAHPGGGWVPVAIGDGAGSHAARRMMPVVIIAPLVLGMLTLIAVRAEWMNAEFRLSVMACLMITLVSSVVLRNGVVQNRIDRRVRDLFDELERTVQQRELLVREVNHRVKNNLQQICAMLYMESMTLDDDTARRSLDEMHQRIRSMATVHNLLVESDGLSRVDASAFLETLCGHCRESLARPGHEFRIALDVAPITLPVETAVSLGMLICEALTNSMKHNPTDHDALEVDLALRQTSRGSVEVEIRDAGAGALGAISPPNQGAPSGKGMTIMRSLVRQLQGDLAITTEGGYAVTVSIPAAMIGEADD